MEINIEEIQSQLAGMDKEALIALVTEARVKQRVATKKYYNPETAKKARQKKAEMLKLAAVQLEKLGLMGEVKARVDAGVAEKLGDTDVSDEDDETSAA
jgi:hypothetical protein